MTDGQSFGEPRNFDEDLARSNDPEVRSEWMRILKEYYGKECIVSFKDDVGVQMQLGTDIVVKTKNGRRYSIELKTRSWREPFVDSWAMEIKSHRYIASEYEKGWGNKIKVGESDGWIYTTTAEFIFHALIDAAGKKILKAICYPVWVFKSEEWKTHWGDFPIIWGVTDFRKSKRASNIMQLTINRLIPREIIKQMTDQYGYWDYGFEEWWQNDRRKTRSA